MAKEIIYTEISKEKREAARQLFSIISMFIVSWAILLGFWMRSFHYKSFLEHLGFGFAITLSHLVLYGVFYFFCICIDAFKYKKKEGK